MARLSLKMPYGEIAVDFTDNEDLKKQLEKIDFEGLVRVISDIAAQYRLNLKRSKA